MQKDMFVIGVVIYENEVSIAKKFTCNNKEKVNKLIDIIIYYNEN